MHDIDHPIEEDRTFQARTWAVQRVAWVLFALVPLLALTGLFTQGPLSDRIAEAGTLTVGYERFQRVTRLTHFTVHIGPGQAGELRLSAPFQQTYAIESIAPRPMRSAAGRDGLRLAFETPADGPLIADIWARPRRSGQIELTAQSGATSVSFHILIYP